MSVIKIPIDRLLTLCRSCCTLIVAFLVVAMLLVTGELAAATKGNSKTNSKQFTLVIDAGHGGQDHGAVDNGQKEKEINLAVAKRLAALVEKKLKDVKVVMTRSDDRFLTLQQRADIANKSKGDLFISIHTNSVDKTNKNRTTVAGSSVYALGLHKDNNNMAVARRENSVIELEGDYKQKYSGFDPDKDESYIIFEMAQKKTLQQSLRFARESQQKLVGVAGRRDRGVHQAGFWVLWATSMPSVLVELDFICNPTQADYLGSSKGRDQLAQALFEAVESYVAERLNARKGRASYMAPSKSEEEEAALTEATDMAGRKTMTLADSGNEVDEPDGTTGTMQLAKAREETKQTAPARPDNPRRQEYAQRRRRSAEARRKSVERDVTTDHIPLHTSDERLAKPVETASVIETVVPELTKEQKKKLEKERKRAAKEAEKAEKERRKNSKVKKAGKFETVYKIQILASADLLKQSNPRFRGLAPISVFRENNLYKYTYGESTKKSEMESLLPMVKAKIPDAFIIQSTHLK